MTCTNCTTCNRSSGGIFIAILCKIEFFQELIDHHQFSNIVYEALSWACRLSNFLSTRRVDWVSVTKFGIFSLNFLIIQMEKWRRIVFESLINVCSVFGWHGSCWSSCARLKVSIFFSFSMCLSLVDVTNCCGARNLFRTPFIELSGDL